MRVYNARCIIDGWNDMFLTLILYPRPSRLVYHLFASDDGKVVRAGFVDRREAAEILQHWRNHRGLVVGRIG